MSEVYPSFLQVSLHSTTLKGPDPFNTLYQGLLLWGLLSPTHLTQLMAEVELRTLCLSLYLSLSLTWLLFLQNCITDIKFFDLV